MRLYNRIIFFFKETFNVIRCFEKKEQFNGFKYFIFNKRRFLKLGYPLFLYKRVFITNKKNISLGKNITIGYNCFISPVKLIVGDNTWLGINNFICGVVSIGSNVSIGPNVNIPGSNHIIDSNEPIAYSGATHKGTIIEDHVWIGGNCSILDGVTIKRGAVVGAGSVVTKDVPEYAVVAGVPAKIIRYRPVIHEKV